MGLSLLVLLFSLGNADENWPYWRGPEQNGVAQADALPVTWNESENILWKAPLPSWSGGTPVIWEDRIFVTSASHPSTSGESPDSEAGGPDLLLLCLSKSRGVVLWARVLDTGNQMHHKQNDSSPSPVTDGTHVWVVTGTGTVCALTMDGDLVWRINLQEKYGPFGLNFGYASSPLLIGSKLIIQVLHGYTTDAPSYLAAFDAIKGDVLWRVDRLTDAQLESPDAYTSPVVLQQEGRSQVVVSGADYVTCHDAESGAELWRASGLNPRNSQRNRMIASPVAVGDMVYAPSSREPTLAIRAGGSGDVTTSHLAWKWDQAQGPDVPTPACDGTFLYLSDDKGEVTCLDAKTGNCIWGPEKTARGIVSASPLLADGKVYLINENGITTVIAAGPEFRVLATNTLPCEGRMLSSPIVSGNLLFLRYPTHLYCIGKTDGNP